MVFKVIIIFLCLFNLSCSSLKFWGSDETPAISEKQKKKEAETLKLFSAANKLLDQGKYAEAKKGYLEILTLSPSSSIETLVSFNLGVSYEFLEECKGAGRSFRKVVGSTLPSQKRLQAQALYHLAKAYECIGKDTKVISTLLDLDARKQWLDTEVAYAEIPARLAGAYARRGNISLAEEYFIKAEKGLSRVNNMRMKENEKKTILAKTLFMMGQVKYKRFSIEKQRRIIKSLEFSQKYLLKSVELNHPMWSPRSAEYILDVYTNMWNRIKTDYPSSDDSSTDVYAQNPIKLELAKSVLTSIKMLERTRFPGSIKQKLVRVLFEQLQKKELLFRNYLSTHSVVTPKTKEDIEKFGIKRKGKLINVK